MFPSLHLLLCYNYYKRVNSFNIIIHLIQIIFIQILINNIL